MEDFRREDWDGREKEIAYSRSVKAGKRIYYLDVKRSRNEDLYLSLTESKKKVTGSADNPEVTYEKHKIFLYKEDLSKFTEALIDVIQFMQDFDPKDSTNHSEKSVLTEKLSDAVDESNTSLDMEDSEPAIKLDLDDFE